MLNSPRCIKQTPLIGTAGWIFPEWKGTFYPYHEKRLLGYYSKVFPFVEVNTTFYAIPNKDTILSWKEQSSPDFVFSVKMINQITHWSTSLSEEEQEKTLSNFFKRVGLLEDKLGAVLLQFPPSFKNNKKNFLFLQKVLNKIISFSKIKFSIPIEFRSFDWYRDNNVYQLLDSFPEACVVQSDRFVDKNADEISLITYIRLIGDRKLITDKEFGLRKVDRNKDLQYWANYISGILELKKRIFVIIGNHFSGHAAIDAIYLASFLEEKGIKTNVNFPSMFPPAKFHQKSLEEY